MNLQSDRKRECINRQELTERDARFSLALYTFPFQERRGDRIEIKQTRARKATAYSIWRTRHRAARPPALRVTV